MTSVSRGILRVIYTKGKKPPKLKPTIVISFIVVVANNYACIGLDKIEERLPILNQPTDKVSFFHVHMLSRRTIHLSSSLLSIKIQEDRFQ